MRLRDRLVIYVLLPVILPFAILGAVIEAAKVGLLAGAGIVAEIFG